MTGAGGGASPFPIETTTRTIERTRASSPDWEPEGGAISGSDRAESPDPGSSSSVSSSESVMNALKPTDSTTLAMEPGSVVFLSNPVARKVGHFVSVRDTEMQATSFARKGKLRRAEELLTQCLPPKKSQDKLTPDLLRIHLKIFVIRLFQGHFRPIEKVLDDITKQMTHFTNTEGPVADERPFLGLRISMDIWRSVLMVAKGLYNQATLDLEKLKIEGTDTNELLRSDEYLRAHLHVTLGMCYANTGNLRGANSELQRAAKIYSANLEPVEEHSTYAILLLDHKMNYYAARSRFEISSGQYDNALKSCRAALDVARSDYGAKHFQALELASIECQILSITSPPSEAEVMCNRTLKLIVKELGPQHPRALETTGHLVDALLARSRFVEATDTVKSLLRQCVTFLGDRHPLTLRSRHQLCRSYMAIGRYATAEIELKKVVGSFTRTHDAHVHIQTVLELSLKLSGTDSIQMDLPTTLKFYSDLAGIFNKLGRRQAARDCAEAVMLQHAKMHSVSASGSEGVGDNFGSKWWTSEVSKATILDGNMLPRSSYGFYRVFESILEKQPHILIHPDVLSTLELLVKVEGHEERRLEESKKVMSFIHGQRVQLFGIKGVATLEGQYRLALFCLDLDNIEGAVEHLMAVWKQRKTVLSPTNSQTLSAERELMITATAQGGALLFSDMSSVDLEASAVNIATMHEWQLGKFHPETLKSLIWVFTMQVGLFSKSVEARHTLSLIQERLGDESVQRERLIECLSVQDSIVWFCETQDMSREAKRIREHVGAVAWGCRLPEDDSKDASKGEIVDQTVAETLRSFRSKFPDSMKRA